MKKRKTWIAILLALIVSPIFSVGALAGPTERVSVDSNGVEGNGDSDYPSISADGRYVAFPSGATNLVAGDTNGALDVFVHDRQTGQTTRVSVDSNGVEGNDNSYEPTISPDARRAICSLFFFGHQSCYRGYERRWRYICA